MNKQRSGVYDLRLPKAKTLRRISGLLSASVVIAALPAAAILAQHPSVAPQQVTIRGKVLSPAGKPAGDAAVRLEREGSSQAEATANADADGVFVFSSISAGDYSIRAEKAGFRSQRVFVHVIPANDARSIDVVLQPVASPAVSGRSSLPVAQTMEFADEPNFTIAGVTDWTAVGGHGSDSTLRTSESLASATVALKPENATQAKKTAQHDVIDGEESERQLREALTTAPQSFSANYDLGAFCLRAGHSSEAIPFLESAYRIDPSEAGAQYALAEAYAVSEPSQARSKIHELAGYALSADLHRLMGDLDEEQGDPFGAVQDYEQAVKLKPSEQNYFKWGSELLLHRAVWQAQEVLRKGVDKYPQSVRMQTALGAALFAGARYNDAALRLCHASDLDPADPTPYIFMGKIQIASPDALPCVGPELKRFLKLQPASSTANYLNAMVILKKQEQSTDKREMQRAETLLMKTLELDPKCSEAYLQLGIIAASEQSFDRAIRFYFQAIKVDPQLADTYYRLGVAYERTGRLADAKQEFQLHDRIKQQQADATEQQRREVKQFLFANPGGIAASAVQ